MTINPVKVALAVQGGLSMICATCPKYWDGRDRNLPGDQCTSKTNCGGPLSGDTFHDYSGPITDFTRWCFVCADKAFFGIRVRSHARVVGVCKEHVKLMAELRPVGTSGDLAYVIKSGNGDVTLRQLQGPKPKSLFKAIQEAEDYFDEKEGKG